LKLALTVEADTRVRPSVLQRQAASDASSEITVLRKRLASIKRRLPRPTKSRP